MIRYRAVFTDPKNPTERPYQLLSNSYPQVEEWTDKRLAAGSPESFIEIFETVERLIATVQNPKWKDASVKLS